MIYIVLSLIATLATLRPYRLYCLSVATFIDFEDVFDTNSLVTLPGVIVFIFLRAFIIMTILAVAATCEDFKKTNTNSDTSTVHKQPQRSDVMSSKALTEEKVIKARVEESLIDDAAALSEQSIRNNNKTVPSSCRNMQLLDEKKFKAAAEQSDSQECDTEPTVKVLLNEKTAGGGANIRNPSRWCDYYCCRGTALHAGVSTADDVRRGKKYQGRGDPPYEQ